MADNIQVGVRLRPLLERELKAGKCVNWGVTENAITQKGVSGVPYTFDYVFDESVNTEVIFTTLACPIVRSVMEGFNGTIFAYGQTSSGKTHTISGTPMEPGIIQLTIQEVFAYIDQHPKREFIIAVSYMEIYNERLTDLLKPTNTHLNIQEDFKHKVSVKGLTDVPVTTPEEIHHLLYTGENNRSIGETTMNERSSRSHAVFGLTVESQPRDEKDDEGTVRIATLNLVDLAGSERASVTGAEGIRFKEGTCINKSLLQLGIVISKLTEGSRTHIPFRDSKLTRILQSSLGGNTKTCIICNITPAEVGETLSTLKFASRAMKVQNKPIVNEVLVGEEAYKKQLKMYEKENEALRRKLEKGLPDQERQQLTQQLEQSERQKAHLEERILSLEDIIVKSSANVSDSTAKAERRRTMCAGFPSHGVIQKATPIAQRRVTFASSPFITRFSDVSDFEKHLDLQEITPVQDHRHTRLIGRPSFIPCTSDYLDDSEESTISSIQVQTVDAECQTDTVAAECQTDTVAAECQTDLELLKLSLDVQQGDASSSFPVHRVKPCSCVDAMTQTHVVSIQHCSEASFCVHCQETRGPRGAVEQMETMQFEFDETNLRMQELQQCLDEVEHVLAVKEAEVREATVNREAMEAEVREATVKREAVEAEVREATVKREAMASKVGDLQMANQAQEELLMTLQSRLKEKNIKLQQVTQQLQQALHESEEKSAAQQVAASELTEVKDQLLALQQKLQKTTQPLPQGSPAVDNQLKLKTAELTAKLAEAERIRKEDDFRFQRSYEQMALQMQKASARACALEEMIETMEQQAGSEEAKMKASLDEKTQLIETLREQCTTSQLQLQSLSTEHEEYASRMEGTVRHLQQQLATSEQLTEAERMRKEDNWRFQKNYEKMALDLQKARERACALEEQIVTHELQAGSEEAKMKSSLDEKSQLIETLSQQCTTTQLQLQSLSTEHEEYASRMEETVRHLQQQLATSEQDSAAIVNQLKSKTAELTAKAGSEEAKMKASLDEKSQLIETLSQQCTTTQLQLQSLSTEHEEYASRMEGTVRHLQQQLATSEQDSAAIVNQLKSKTAELTAKLAEAERFQKSYEKATLDLQKARERACALEEHIATWEQQAGSEEAKMKSSLDEKSQLIETLSQQCTTTQLQLQSLSTEHEEYASRMEGTVRHLQQQLATSEQDSAAIVKSKTAELTAKLTEAERMRKEDNLRFQKSYEKMEMDIQKAHERECTLEQQIATYKEQAGSEEAKMKASLDEKSQLIETLSQQCTTTKLQLQSLSTEYQDYASRMEWRVQHLQKQLATSEQLTEAERTRKEEDLRFQKRYEKMELDIQKAHERECALEEQCTTTQRELQSLKADYQQYIIGKEETISDLKQQLATSEQLKSECKNSLAADMMEHQLRELRMENARLRTKIQGQAVRPSESASLVTDGSGFVTGVAMHQMRQEKQLLTRQNDQLTRRVQKLKDEFTAEREKLNGVREELKRYRQERNIFRAKYQCLKADCKCGAVNSDYQDDLSSNPAPSRSTSTYTQPSSTSQPPTTLEKLPSPKPPRKSILSWNPDRDLQPGRKPFSKAVPLAEPTPENVKPLEPRRLRRNPGFVWEQTLLESSEETRTEQPQQCQQQ